MESTLLLSLNETEALAAKAARGAGLGWGQAEDIGRAVRWLAQHDFDWSEALVRLLRSPAELECLAAAFQAADRAFGAKAGYRGVTGPCPVIWTLSILATTMRGRAATLTLRSRNQAFRLLPDGSASTDSARARPENASPQVLTIEACAVADPLAQPMEPKSRRGSIQATVWRELERYAARTYVPASAQSREHGAGAGRTDAD